MNEEILIWTDVETFGLEPYSEIIEVGFLVTDLDLNEIDRVSRLVWDDWYEEAWGNAHQIVRDMHTKNKLINEARSVGVRPQDVEESLTSWIMDNHYDGNPLCGSSVHQDRLWLMTTMPRLLRTFHYRIIDNSSIKELCKRYNPSVYDSAPEGREQHRVIPDMEDSVEEFRFYRDEFLLWR